MFYFSEFGKSWLYDSRHGLDTSTYHKIKRYEDAVYLLSARRLYEKSMSNGTNPGLFTVVPDIETPVDDFIVYKNKLLISNFFGLHFLKNKKVTRIFDSNDSAKYYLLNSIVDDMILSNGESSIMAFKESSNNGLSGEVLFDIGGSVDAMTLTGDNEVWAANNQKGIYRIKLIQEEDKVRARLIKHYIINAEQEFADSAVKMGLIHDRVILLSQNGIYIYDLVLDIFIQEGRLESWLGTALSESIPGNSGPVWLGLQKKQAEKRMGPLLARWSFDSYGNSQLDYYWTPLLNDLQRINSISRDNSDLSNEQVDVLWVGGEGAALKFEIDDEMKLGSVPAAVITGVSDMEGNALSAALPVSGVQNIPYDQARLLFNFSVESRQFGEKFRYSIFVEGLDSDWREPVNQRRFELAGLREGAYVFRVRAIDVGGFTGAETRYSFQILPPWHRTTWAYACYLLIFMLFAFALYRLRTWQQRIRTQQLEEVVQLRTRQLEEANAAKNDFLSRMSHELRNPMNGVIGSSELLGHSGLTGDQKSLVGIIHSCSRHLNQMIGDILDFSRVDAGRVTLDNRPFQLNSLVREVIDVNRYDAEKAKVELLVDWKNTVPYIFEADVSKIRQILINFISNSIKYGGSQNVVLSIDSVLVLSTTASVTFEVIDTGKGIPDDEKELVFQRFYRSRNVVNSRIRGTGVGLAVCKAFADCMGADIGVRDNSDGGSIFFFRVNLKISEKRGGVNEAELPELKLKGKRALVVDDMEYNRLITRQLLESLKLEVDLAESGEESLAYLDSEQYDFVFMDWDLPDLNGVEVTRRFRQTNSNRKDHYTQIFATTAYSTRQKYMECIRAGMDGFLGKPITLDKIRDVLSNTKSQSYDELLNESENRFDLSTIDLLSHGDPGHYKKNVRLYLKTLEVELESLHGAMRKGSSEAVRKCAHRLLSHVAIISAHDLTRILRSIQEKARLGDLDGVPELITGLVEESNILREQLSEILSKIA